MTTTTEDKPTSRQARWQEKMRQLGKCTCCGKPSAGRIYCLECMVQKREDRRKRLGHKRRYRGAASYCAQEREKFPVNV